MALADSWHVRNRSRECAATQQPFADEQPIITALFPDPESSGYLRKDYCVDAWGQRDKDSETPFSFWKTTFTSPNSDADPDPMENLSPEELLARLIEEDQEHTENTRYILAVMLERKKLLRETDNQQTPTGILRVYEHRKTGEVFLVRDPNIPLAEIEAIQAEVFLLLENNGRLPEPEVEPAQDPETTDENSESLESEDEPEAASGETDDKEPTHKEPEPS